MATAPRPRPLDVAHIAGRILNAQRSEYQVNLQQELARAKRVLGDIHPADTLETERLEVLESAIESIESPVRARAVAAMYLLEQLAGVDMSPISRRSLPA